MDAKTRRLKTALARKSFKHYVELTMPEFDFEWYHLAIIDALQDVAEGKCSKLIIQLGPRRGKTELVWRRFTTWYHGLYPHRAVMAASYGEQLSAKNTRDCKRIISSPTYQEIFPLTVIDGKNTNLEYELTAGGYYRGAGVGQGIGGFGANLLVADDLYRTRQIAESETSRESIWEWLNDDAINRVEHPGAVVLMFTRWHIDDAIGRILASEEAADWRVVSIPAILEHEDQRAGKRDHRELGECIVPGMKPESKEELRASLSERLGYAASDEELYEERQRMELAALNEKRRRNPYGFEALQQCCPFLRGGGLFKNEWWETYDVSPKVMAKSCQELLISVDATFKKSKRSDYVSITVWGRSQRSIYLIDEIHARMDFPETKLSILNMHRKWPRATVIIELAANGEALVSSLRALIGRVIGVKVSDSKEARAQLAADLAESRQVYLPNERWAPWIKDWKAEVEGFPGYPNDDRVDSFSQVAHRWDNSSDTLTHLRRVLGR